MRKFLSWLKSIFVKVEPVVAVVAPEAALVVETADPKLKPLIDGIEAVVKAGEKLNAK